MINFSPLIIAILDGPLTIEHIILLKRSFAAVNKMADLPSNVQLLQAYRALVKAGTVSVNKTLEQLLKKRAVRSQSGIVAVQVLTKPFWCPGKCIFCPNDPQQPKSYISSEPGAQRAFLNQFDPVKQVQNRLDSLYATGHPLDKIEMIVLGGTRDVYPDDYKKAFVKGLYDACNGVVSDTLEQSLFSNETAERRIIGLTIETRPEYVTDENCGFWRNLGVTRIEMGVQSLFDEVLEANKRGHTVQQIREACHKMRQRGFKFSVHIMPGLYQSTYQKDLETFERLYTDPFLKPDEIKFYPTSVIPGTELYDLYTKGEYVPLETAEIIRLIETVFEKIVPPYTRIKRLIRDIPAQEIAAGSSVTNLHQLVENDLLKRDRHTLYERLQECVVGESGFDLVSPRNFVSLDTRSREMRNRKEGQPLWVKIVTRSYESSVGQEYFLSMEDELGYLYGFARLLLPSEGNKAMIRELHVYGDAQKLGISGEVQHTGFGKQLMQAAEQLAQEHHYQKLSVIAGIGVREYYRKLGFVLEDTYMVKYF